MHVQDAVRRQVEDPARHDLPVVGEDAEVRSRGAAIAATASGSRRRSGCRTCEPELARPGPRPGSASARRVATGRAIRRRHDADDVDRRDRREQRSRIGTANAAAAEEDGPRRAPGSAAVAGHASARRRLAALASSSSSSPAPTGISSSIESR